MFMPNQNSELNRTQDIRTGSITGRKIKIVSGKVKKEVRVKSKVVNYNNFIQNEKQIGKEETSKKSILKEKEKSQVKIEKESQNTSKNLSRKVRKVSLKENKEGEKPKDKLDPKLLKKLAEVHSFHQPPLPKLEEEQYSNDISIDDIKIGEVIGQGAYAVVKKGFYIPANLTIAIKIYDKSNLEEPQRRKSVKREIKLMEIMDNEYIVKLYGVIETRHQLYILMEYVSGVSLHGYMKLFQNRRLPEDEARRIFQQLMLGLQYCHKK